MDERKQYTPTSLKTYPADNNTIGYEPETIVREASDKETYFKNTKDLPIEGVEGSINFHRYHDGK
jgi:hypothetical protein